MTYLEKWYIQGVSEIRVLILTNGRMRQFMKVSLYHFAKFAKVFQDYKIFVLQIEKKFHLTSSVTC
jgi:hypothetical protein